ncbi:hypothetical protein AC480_01895, partial [miscellaneous Crenarchaeota group archaeon SMTZ1-55]
APTCMANPFPSRPTMMTSAPASSASSTVSSSEDPSMTRISEDALTALGMRSMVSRILASSFRAGMMMVASGSWRPREVTGFKERSPVG